MALVPALGRGAPRGIAGLSHSNLVLQTQSSPGTAQDKYFHTVGRMKFGNTGCETPLRLQETQVLLTRANSLEIMRQGMGPSARPQAAVDAPQLIFYSV